MNRAPILRDRGAIMVRDVSNQSTRDSASGLIDREINFWQTLAPAIGSPIAMGGLPS